jgi:hypothetical protein
MAIVIPGKSCCVLCGELIATPEIAIAFPAFIPPRHELARFSDQVFHRECYVRWHEHNRFQALYDAYLQIWSSRPPFTRMLIRVDPLRAERDRMIQRIVSFSAGCKLSLL